MVCYPLTSPPGIGIKEDDTKRKLIKRRETIEQQELTIENTICIILCQEWIKYMLKEQSLSCFKYFSSVHFINNFYFCSTCKSNPSGNVSRQYIRAVIKKNNWAESILCYSTALLTISPLCVCFQKARVISTRDSCAYWHLVVDQWALHTVSVSVYVGSWLPSKLTDKVRHQKCRLKWLKQIPFCLREKVTIYLQWKRNKSIT